MQYKFRLDKLHCAGCALALEQNINTLEGVEAKISFVTKVLELNIDTDNPAETLTEVKVAIKRFDRMVEILPYEQEVDEVAENKRRRLFDISRFAIAVLLMITNIVIDVKWIEIANFAAAYVIVAYEVLFNAVVNVIHGKVSDENFLMSVASVGAFVIGEYLEAVSVMLLFGIGEMLEDLAVSRSRRTIERVLEIKQPYANLVVGDGESQVDLSQVRVGDIIRVKPGERVPLDGVVVEGTSYFDMSALTGETQEKIVKSGDTVLSGAINVSSVLLVKVEKTEQDSTVSKIVDMVQNATETKAKSEKFISKFSKRYTPTVLILALIIAFIPPIFSGYSNFLSFAYRALCFLVVSCPCALVISVPLSYFAGIGACARDGIMVKGANFLEELAKVNAVVFDKTGTLTEGRFEISEIYATSGHSNDELIELAAYAENYSNHKIAKSILKAYKEVFHGKDINGAWIDDYKEFPGLGIKANIFMQPVLVGNAKLLRQEGVSFVEMSNKAGTVLYIATGEEFAGYIVVSDVTKKDSRKAVDDIKALGINDISVCTGDEENVAKAISLSLGIKNYHSGLLPEDKVDIITDKVQAGKVVAFVGDGINDAPSLANSNVGIAMGALGSDIAIESADVVVMTDEPSKVAKAIKKAKKTRKIVLQNIIGSIGLKVLVLGLVSMGLAGMWLAVFADVGVSLLAVLNSLRTMIK